MLDEAVGAKSPPLSVVDLFFSNNKALFLAAVVFLLFPVEFKELVGVEDLEFDSSSDSEDSPVSTFTI